MNKQNLINLAELLDTDTGIDFDMNRFSQLNTVGFEQIHKDQTCGSVGCAIGWFSILEPKPTEQTWVQYSEEKFGLNHESIEWDWLFSCFWAMVDNTTEGAISRIIYFLENGVPEWFAKFRENAELIIEDEDELENLIKTYYENIN